MQLKSEMRIHIDVPDALFIDITKRKYGGLCIQIHFVCHAIKPFRYSYLHTFPEDPE